MPENGIATIRSPNYPNKYESNQDCVWIAEIALGSRIRIIFTNFSTEAKYDYLEVGNGDNHLDMSTRVIMHSGPTTPKNFVSSGNVIWIHFQSDDDKEETGFIIEIKDDKLISKYSILCNHF